MSQELMNEIKELRTEVSETKSLVLKLFNTIDRPAGNTSGSPASIKQQEYLKSLSSDIFKIVKNTNTTVLENALKAIKLMDQTSTLPTGGDDNKTLFNTVGDLLDSAGAKVGLTKRRKPEDREMTSKWIDLHKEVLANLKAEVTKLDRPTF